ncbi:MAG: glutamate--tRNA ligase [Candidatus Dormibacteria bacterium]
MRFAPSPTGALHIGTVRTALFAWLSARHTGGQFVLRIEDTDQARHVPGSERQIIDSLTWLGLQWDEGPDVGGPHAPYVQSERRSLYRDHAEQLVGSGHAYWCTCSPQRLQQMREAQQAARQPTRYDRRCLARQGEVAAERAAGEPAALRLRMPEGRTEWDDVVRGPIVFENAEIDDQVLLKSDGFPTYHLANVVDDHLMEISHVIRAEEWIPSTPKHIALYDAFGWPKPRFAHVPNVLGEDGRAKLSKRRGARFILEYRELGYLPEAMLNAMALLGWSSGTEDEFFTPAQLVERFDLHRVNPGGAVFDPRRLDALNGQHIRDLPAETLALRLRPWLPSATAEQLRDLVPLVQERMVRLDEAPILCGPLLGEAPWEQGVAFPPKKVDAGIAAGLLRASAEAVRDGGLDNLQELRAGLTEWLELRGVKARDGFRTLYVAIVGRPVGVPVFDAMRFIGVDTTLRRLEDAQAKLGTQSEPVAG